MQFRVAESVSICLEIERGAVLWRRLDNRASRNSHIDSRANIRGGKRACGNGTIAIVDGSNLAIVINHYGTGSSPCDALRHTVGLIISSENGSSEIERNTVFHHNRFRRIRTVVINLDRLDALG